MERLVRLLCWLLDCEQHLDESNEQEKKHKERMKMPQEEKVPAWEREAQQRDGGYFMFLQITTPPATHHQAGTMHKP